MFVFGIVRNNYSDHPGQHHLLPEMVKIMQSATVQTVPQCHSAKFHSAKVPVFYSTTVPQCQSTSVLQCQSDKVSEFHNTTLPQCQSTPVLKYQSSTVPQCQSTRVPQYHSATVPKYHSTTLPQCHSTTVLRRWGVLVERDFTQLPGSEGGERDSHISRNNNGRPTPAGPC